MIKHVKIVVAIAVTFLVLFSGCRKNHDASSGRPVKVSKDSAKNTSDNLQVPVEKTKK